VSHCSSEQGAGEGGTCKRGVGERDTASAASARPGPSTRHVRKFSICRPLHGLDRWYVPPPGFQPIRTN
jgi:hypothetical protein